MICELSGGLQKSRGHKLEQCETTDEFSGLFIVKSFVRKPACCAVCSAGGAAVPIISLRVNQLADVTVGSYYLIQMWYQVFFP